MNSNQQLSSNLSRTVVPKKGSRVDILSLIFPQWIVKKYWRNRKSYKFVGVILGALLLTVLIQYPATAQLFDQVKTGTNVIEKYIPGLSDVTTFLVQAVQLVMFGGGLVGVVGGAYSQITNRGWENWIPIGSTMMIASGLIYFWQENIYG